MNLLMLNVKAYSEIIHFRILLILSQHCAKPWIALSSKTFLILQINIITKEMKKIITLLALLVFATTANSNILNVPSGYTTIQAAINASVNGDTVLVAAGTYMENINF